MSDNPLLRTALAARSWTYDPAAGIYYGYDEHGQETVRVSEPLVRYILKHRPQDEDSEYLTLASRLARVPPTP